MFDFGIKDFIDILCVALMLYYIYRLMRESRSINVFIGIMVFILMWLFVSQVLEMRLLGSIMDKLVSVGVIAIIILFQEEIRKFLYNLGTHRKVNSIIRLFSSGEKKDKGDMEAIMPVVMACMSMGKNKVGALIVIERLTPLDEVIATGDVIDANINQRLIENIFFKNSPLHDGAMVIVGNRITAAKCVLPSTRSEVPLSFGMRHRAALGAAEVTDAIVVVVSEETGNISVAHNGRIKVGLSSTELQAELMRLSASEEPQHSHHEHAAQRG